MYAAEKNLFHGTCCRMLVSRAIQMAGASACVCPRPLHP